jgi:hypothetical protein
MPQAGEIWLAEIPFTSGVASKLRPVLVLWQDGAAGVAFDRVTERAGGNAIEHRQIGVEQHLLPSHEMSQSLDPFSGRRLRHWKVVHDCIG